MLNTVNTTTDTTFRASQLPDLDEHPVIKRETLKDILSDVEATPQKKI